MVFIMTWVILFPVVLIMLLSIGPTSTFAGTFAGLPDASLPFCKNPFAATCPGKNADKVREQKIAKIESELKGHAFESMLEEIEDENVKAVLQNFDDIDSVKPKRIRQAVEKIFYEKLREEFSRYISENNLPINLGDELVKEALHIAVEEEEFIAPSIKEKMHTILNETRFLAFQNNVEDNSLDDLHALYKLCTKSFEDNAFATTLKKEKVVVICPGEMIGAIEFGQEFAIVPNLKLYPLVMTLGHELSHHFDFKHYPSAYKQILEEMAEHRSEFKKPVEKYMREITADIWGLKVAKIVMSKIGNPLTRSKMYAGSLNDLCGSEDDGVHPSGKFRIEKLASEYLCQ